MYSIISFIEETGRFGGTAKMNGRLASVVTGAKLLIG
jgi:hypothetical protein